MKLLHLKLTFKSRDLNGLMRMGTMTDLDPREDHKTMTEAGLKHSNNNLDINLFKEVKTTLGCQDESKVNSILLLICFCQLYSGYKDIIYAQLSTKKALSRSEGRHLI